jgi:hypothetical protein
VGGKVERLVHIAFAVQCERFFEHLHQSLELRLAGTRTRMGHGGSDGVGFDFLKTHDVGQRLQCGNAPAIRFIAVRVLAMPRVVCPKYRTL